MDAPKKRKLWAPLALVAALSWLAIDRGLAAIHEHREALRVRSEQLLATMLGRDFERRILTGPTGSDDAWPHYQSAMRLQSGGGSFEAVRAALATGALARSARYVTDWEDGFAAESLDVLACSDLADWLLDPDHRAHLDANDTARLAVEVAVFGRDIAQCDTLVAHLVGFVVMDKSLEVLRDQALLRDVSPAQRERLATELAALDDSLPPPDLPFRMESALVGKALLGGQMPVDLGQPVPNWFYDTAVDLLSPHAVEEFQAAMERIAESTTRPWAEACDILDQVEADAKASINPISARLFLADRAHVEPPRRIRCELRMLRMALHHDTEQRPLVLEDPYGGDLQLAVTDDEFRAWSRDEFGNPRSELVWDRL